MIKVHHLNNSRSQRVIWLLEELGLEYEIVNYKRNPLTQLAPNSLKKIHPLGKSPVLEDGNNIIAESGNIFEYLLTKYDEKNLLHPKREEDIFWNYNFWLHFSEGSLMAPLVMSLILNKVTSAPMPFFMKPAAKLLVKAVNDGYVGKQVKVMFDHIEKELEEKEWLLGDNLSAADMIMSFPLEASMASKLDGVDYPNIKKYVEKFKDLKKYKIAIDKGGEYIY